MSTRAQQHTATVERRTALSPHLVRLELRVPGFVSTGVPDEWVGLVVPGQFQSRYYTVREVREDQGETLVVLDVVVHAEGLVTEWVGTDVVGQQVVVTEAKGSFEPPPGAGWLLLVGDLTALPAMARIAESTELPTRVHAELPGPPTELADYLPARVEAVRSTPPAEGASALAAVVEALAWPEGEGYFWMAGESSAMRAIRSHLMRERRLAPAAYDVMGYWRGGAVRRPRAVDPAPAHRVAP